MAIKTISVAGEGARYEALVTSGQTVTPGMLVALQSDGTVKAHPNAGQPAEAAFAVEDDLQGKDIDETYAAGSICQYEIFKPGDKVYAYASTSQTIAKGDFLQSAGDGYFQKYAADSAGAVEYPNSIKAVAAEAKTTTGTAARMLVRIV